MCRYYLGGGLGYCCLFPSLAYFVHFGKYKIIQCEYNFFFCTQDLLLLLSLVATLRCDYRPLLYFSQIFYKVTDIKKKNLIET